MSEVLRQQIAAVVLDHLTPPKHSGASWTINPTATADAILSLPEMQNLNSAAFMALSEPPFTRARQWCDEYLLPSVRAWIIGESAVGVSSQEEPPAGLKSEGNREP